MNRRLIFSIVLLSIINSSVLHAADPHCPNAVTLAIGDRVTDCKRIGLREDYAKELQSLVINFQYDRQLIESQKKSIEIKDLRIKNLEEQTETWKKDSLSERQAFDREASKNKYQFILGVVAGVVGTLGSAYLVNQIFK